MEVKGQGEIILVVEDDPYIRAVLQESLETFNFCVLTAVNGREALAIYQSRGDEIALVISDLVMPEMGGEQLLRALQQLNPTVQVIIITGYPLESASTELQESDAVAWLQKPINLEQLSNIVGGILQRSA